MVENADSLLYYPTVALVAATVGLLIVTFYYAVQTRNTVREMKRATEMQFLPSLTVSFLGVITRSGGLTLRIRNIGRGPAVHIRLKLFLIEEPAITDELLSDLLPEQLDEMCANS